MRLKKTFDIEGHKKKFEVNELTVKEIIDLSKDKAIDKLSVDALKELFQTRLLPLCSNIELDDLIEMAPSELKIIWDNFEEVNKTFFELARNAGIGQTLGELKKAIIADFSSLAVPLSKQAT
jgi:predicted RNase H-like nuclease (RuvC/YqgF family)